MNDSTANSAPQEYDTDSTINRQPGEAYKLDIWLLDGPTTPSTRAFTYGRTEGLYKLNPDDTEEIVEAFDEVVSSLQEKYGAVDEFEFERITGDAYEVLAEIVEPTDASAYDAEFEHNSSVLYVTPENDPDLVEKIDEAFEALEETVSDQ